MNDKFRIDSHKLIFHPRRVADWLEARGDGTRLAKIYPIYVEISPVGFCNHRCTFCALDFMEYKNRRLDPAVLKDRLSEMASLGVKSVMFAGEGEPALYRELPEIIEHCAAVGIDTSLTTNMVPFNESSSEVFVKYCKWIKVSINAGNAKNYSEIHRTDERDYDRVVNNMKRCVEIRRKNGYKCTLGAQLLLVSDNYGSVVELAAAARDIGLDYLVVKPYSQHLSSHTNKYRDMDYSRYTYLQDELKKFNSESFNVIFRINTMNKLIERAERYKKCGSVPFFWAYVMSDGGVYGCSAFLEDERFNYGNIHEKTFREIWESERRMESIRYVREELCIEKCRVNCRMDEVNRYLWELVNPNPHVNFI